MGLAHYGTTWGLSRVLSGSLWHTSRMYRLGSSVKIKKSQLRSCVCLFTEYDRLNHWGKRHRSSLATILIFTYSAHSIHLVITTLSTDHSLSPPSRSVRCQSVDRPTDQASLSSSSVRPSFKLVPRSILCKHYLTSIHRNTILTTSSAWLKEQTSSPVTEYTSAPSPPTPPHPSSRGR